jgi:hypothetical protein
MDSALRRRKSPEPVTNQPLLPQVVSLFQGQSASSAGPFQGQAHYPLQGQVPKPLQADPLTASGHRRAIHLESAALVLHMNNTTQGITGSLRAACSDPVQRFLACPFS